MAQASLSPIPTSGRSVPPAERLTDHMERPALDDRTYRVIRLPNKLEALLIHDPDTDKVSAALDVNVGSFSDADDMPGMAHAVEHLLFMGTKKYPQENAYNQYLTSRSGYSNAYTASTSTNYYFELSAFSTPANSKISSAASSIKSNGVSSKPTSPLYGALDRFAQFFVAPLFLEDTLDRELRAVDSENKKNLQLDTWRLHQLNKTLSNPNHPFCHFSTGNYVTLHDEPLERGVKIRDEFINFYEKNYSANRMKLVVLGREDLDELESWVQELFAEVPNKDLPQNRWDGVPPFTEKELGMQVFAKPVFESRTLDLYFPYQDEERLYESQPGRYLSHLIGHEGPGSILSYLKGKGLANGLSSGALPLCPGSALFTVSVRLTEEGLKQYQQVTEVVFQYIAMLQQTPPQEWVVEEMKKMSEVEFRFKQKSPPSKTTSSLSNTMQKPLPREWLLSGSHIVRKFNPEGIKAGLACLRPDNCRLTIVSNDYPGDWDKKEKWYGTEYKYERMPEDFQARLQKAAKATPDERPAELHLPHKNEFIPTRLDVEKKEVDEPAKAPRLIRCDENVRTWYKKDDRFWVPKANLHITLRTPLASLTPQTAVMTSLYRELVNDALSEYSYAADISGLEYDLANHSVGIDVNLSGYNVKMSVLLEKVLHSLRDLEVRDDRFLIMKERFSRALRNWEYQQPYYQVGVNSRWLTIEKGWINEQYLAELPQVTAVDIRNFYPQLLRQAHVEVLAHGNLHKEEVLQFADLVESIMQPRRLPASQWPIRRSLVIPEGSNFIYERPLKDPANVNHCIEYTLAIGNNQDRALRAKALLLAQITDEPAFNQLRTKEQLGYVVFSGTSINVTRLGYRILIQSERTPDYLEGRIDAFLSNMREDLRNMTEEDFEAHKTSLINKRLETLKNLTKETDRFWGHIMSEAFDFEQVDHDVTHIEPLTKSEMLTFFDYYIDPSSSTRAKISVHLVAQTSPKTIAENTTPEEQKTRLVQMVGKYFATQGIVVDPERLASRFKDVDVSGGDTDAIVGAVATYLSKEVGADPVAVQAVVDNGKEVMNSILPTVGIETAPVVNGDGEKAIAKKQEPVYIKDVHAFKASMAVSPGTRPVRDLSEYEDLESKL